MTLTADRLFTQARTATFFLESPAVDDATLHALYELLKWGPTASNCCPARFVFVRTPQAKERLLTCLRAYLIIAARALGLDAAPMGGIDAASMDAEFFAGTTVKSHMVCCLGHADVARQRPRNPRLPFEQACRLV